MKRINLYRAPIVVCFTLLAIVTSLSYANAPQPVESSKSVKWGPAPPMLPKGAEIAVLAGNPAEAGLISLRLKVPKGYIVPPHWHPMAEQVTVVSGTVNLGMGEKLDKSKSQEFSAGGFYSLPAQKAHFAWTSTGAVIQIALMGPFAITYVNPADDPRGSVAKK